MDATVTPFEYQILFVYVRLPNAVRLHVGLQLLAEVQPGVAANDTSEVDQVTTLIFNNTHTRGVNSLSLIMFDSSFLGQQRLLIPREDFWLFPEISLRRASHGRLVASPGMVMKPSLCLSHLLALHTPPRLIELLPSS